MVREERVRSFRRRINFANKTEAVRVRYTERKKGARATWGKKGGGRNAGGERAGGHQTSFSREQGRFFIRGKKPDSWSPPSMNSARKWSGRKVADVISRESRDVRIRHASSANLACFRAYHHHHCRIIDVVPDGYLLRRYTFFRPLMAL